MTVRWFQYEAIARLCRELVLPLQFPALTQFHRKHHPKFVLLTSGGIHSKLLSSFLKSEGYDFEIVVCRILPPKRLPGRSLLRHWLTLMVSRLKSNPYARVLLGRARPAFSKAHVYGGFLNSRRLTRTLRQLSPSYILLMNIGVVNREVIRTARVGVLNAHPGLLPWIRGVDAVASSLLEGVAPGTTVHFVNEGIDTGPILCRHLLPPEIGTGLEQLKRAANMQALMAMIRVIEGIEDGEALSGEAQTQRFALHRRLKQTELDKAHAMALVGRAEELYERWRNRHLELEDGAVLLAKYAGAASDLSRKGLEEVTLADRPVPVFRPKAQSTASAGISG